MKYLLSLCGGYFTLYVIFGMAMKYFLKIAKINGMVLFGYSLLASMPIVLAYVLWKRWPQKLESEDSTGFLGRYPTEYKWIGLSGVCTGFVIPTTALLYTFGFSVMVAMIIMRSSLIVISVFVDWILIYQGHSTKKVRPWEYAAVIAALGAVAIIIGTGFVQKDKGHFNFLGDPMFMGTMALYIVPYGFRIYILNRFKTKVNQKAIFGIEQISAFGTVALGVTIALLAFHLGGWKPPQMTNFAHGLNPINWQFGPMFWFTSYGGVAFVSVFIYLYRDGSATFNTTLNRMTSLLAGTVATVLLHEVFGLRAVRPHEWGAFGMVILALFFLGMAGRATEKEKAVLQAATA